MQFTGMFHVPATVTSPFPFPVMTINDNCQAMVSNDQGKNYRPCKNNHSATVTTPNGGDWRLCGLHINQALDIRSLAKALTNGQVVDLSDLAGWERELLLAS